MDGTVVAIGAPETLPPTVRAVPCEPRDVVDAVRSVHDDVLLAVRDAKSRRVARSVRLALGAERIGILHTPTPYTAWIATVLMLGSMPADVALSRSAGVARAVSEVLRTRVVLSNVAALANPSPTLRQHLAGTFWRTRFLVDLTAGSVTALSGALDATSPLVVVARSAKPVVRDLEVGWPDRRVDVGVVEAGWKASRWVEVTTLDEVRWNEVSGQLRQERAPQCVSCDRPGSRPACLFCDIPLPSASTTQPAGAHA
ncbi:hypothetical protein [Xylanimonas ulmi]|uniref:Uncharacterized protein n=1 Tax=Xylanimonas ulmi TaxID=228973 RepID=A0A4Q7MA27_9MICO|nr:hypothetical protein [Xylanibacterium ulmi]RZS63079.1 hypothetical protein EV386_3437 [Xylanibacterium ulmi]